MRPGDPTPRFEIWQAGNRIHSIDNPVRLRILRWLEHQPSRLTDLVKHVGKAKSTLSALHIPPLLEARLIEEVSNPQDARVKIYRLVGHRLGSSAVEAKELRDAVLSYVEGTGAIPLGALLRIVDPEALVASGARADYVEEIARRIGQSLARMLTHDEFETAVRELSDLLEAASLGLVETSRQGPPRVAAFRPELQPFVTRIAEEALHERFGRTVRLAVGPKRSDPGHAVRG